RGCRDANAGSSEGGPDRPAGHCRSHARIPRRSGRLTMAIAKRAQPIARGEQDDRTAQEWAAWFHGALMPWWLEQARDSVHGGFFDALTEDGVPLNDDPKTTLAQARLLFTLSHLYLQKRDDRLLDGARAAHR